MLYNLATEIPTLASVAISNQHNSYSCPFIRFRTSSDILITLAASSFSSVSFRVRLDPAPISNLAFPKYVKLFKNFEIHAVFTEMLKTEGISIF